MNKKILQWDENWFRRGGKLQDSKRKSRMSPYSRPRAQEQYQERAIDHHLGSLAQDPVYGFVRIINEHKQLLQGRGWRRQERSKFMDDARLPSQYEQFLDFSSSAPPTMGPPFPGCPENDANKVDVQWEIKGVTGCQAIIFSQCMEGNRHSWFSPGKYCSNNT